MSSVAALLAVSAARAADAPVTMVEPEPVDYVRVCDVYGIGFFYLPGTETCFKYGGYLRARVNASSKISGTPGGFGTLGDADLDNGPFDRDYDVNTQLRTRLEFDTREETELGTLRGFIRFQSTNISGSDLGYGTSDNEVDLDQGFIQIGGLTVGRLDSLWAENDGLYLDNDWSVGDLANNQIRYTFETNGFALSASVEDDGDGDAIPDVVAQVLYKSAWGSAYISGVWDEDNYDPNPRYDPLTFNPLLDIYPLDPYGNDSKDSGAFALKAGVELKDLIYSGSSVKVEGHYAFDPTEYASLAPGGYLLGIEAEGNTNSNFSIVSLPEEWQIGAGYQQSFGKLTAYASGIYGETFDIAYLNGVSDKSELWGVGGSLGYQLTSNASVLGEVTYRKVDLKGGLDDLGQTRGFLQFLREF